MPLGKKRLLKLEDPSIAWQRFQRKVSIKIRKDKDYLELLANIISLVEGSMGGFGAYGSPCRLQNHGNLTQEDPTGRAPCYDKALWF